MPIRRVVSFVNTHIGISSRRDAPNCDGWWKKADSVFRGPEVAPATKILEGKNWVFSSQLYHQDPEV